MVGSGFFRRADVHIISFCEWPCLTLGPALMRLRQSHSRRTRSRLPYGCYPAPLGLRQTNRVCTAVVSPCGFQFGNIGHRPAKYIDRNQLRKVTRTLAKNEIGAMGIPPYHIGGSCLVRFRSRGACLKGVSRDPAQNQADHRVLRPTLVGRQMRFDPRPLLIVEPKQAAIHWLGLRGRHPSRPPWPM
jgi:hypothetical protein